MEAMYFNRDISWLSFNERVLQEAADRSLPVMDRLQFLSIFSSNLDEFYSVRVPIATAMEKLQGGKTLSVITDRVNSQMKYFGSIFQDDLIPYLASRNVNVLFNQQVPDFLQHNISQYFFSRVMGYLQPILLSQLNDPHIIQNNKLQLLAMLKDSELNQQVAIVNVPVDYLSRFYVDDSQGVRTILFLEDLIKANLAMVFPQYQIGSVYSFKITRDAELDLRDEYKGSLVKKLEKKLKMRAFGLPSRFLYEPGLPPEVLRDVARRLGLEHASLVPGGHYHNLRDLAALPVPAHSFSPAPSWTP